MSAELVRHTLFVFHLFFYLLQGPEGGGPNSHSVCEDTIYFYPYALTSAGAMYPITHYIETGFLENHPRDELQPVVLTRSSNNQQFSYKMDRNIINIVFKTCPETSDIKTRGNGFRLLTYASGESTAKNLKCGAPEIFNMSVYCCRIFMNITCTIFYLTEFAKYDVCYIYIYLYVFHMRRCVLVCLLEN